MIEISNRKLSKTTQSDSVHAGRGKHYSFSITCTFHDTGIGLD